MADDNKLVVSIELDDGSVKRGLLSLEQETTSTFKRIGETAAGVFAAQALIAGFEKIKDVVKEAFSAVVESASESDQAIQKLNTALGLAGRFSESASRDFQNLADRIQETTTISDDTVLGLEALAIAYTKNNAQALKLTETSINLAAVTDKDVNGSLQALASTLSGQAGRLSRLFPELKTFTSEQLKAGAAIDFFNSKFAGAAERQANTYAGAIAQLKNAFDDTLESIGKYVTQSPAILTTIKFIADQFRLLTATLNGGRQGDAFAGLLQSTAQVGAALNTFILYPLEVILQTIDALVAAFITGLKGVNFAVSLVGDTVISLGRVLGSLSADFFGLLSGTLSFGDFIKSQADIANKINFNQANASFVGLGDTALAAFTKINTFGNSTPITDRISKSLEEYQAKLASAQSATSETFNSIAGSAAEGAQKVVAKIDEISRAVGQGLVKAIVAGVSALGASLVTGTLSFRTFLNSVLAVLGDLAIQVGTILIGIGLGIEQLKVAFANLNGGLAIAAGVALVALGGALKALSGGGVQSPTSGTVAAGGGGGFVPTDSTSPSTVEDIEERQPKIQVNIQGDVLDSRDTGLRIIDIINEQFNSSGARILAT